MNRQKRREKYRDDYVWNDIGIAPSANEIEVSVIGPGYGESVVVHLGNGEWLIVDSCVDTTNPSKPVLPLMYLKRLGVRVEDAVKLIVISHWDDDHVRGIGEIVEACHDARVVTSKQFPEPKFISFIEALSKGSGATDGASIRNIRKVLHCLADRGTPIVRATPGRQLCGSPNIYSWSPSDHDDDEFVRYLSTSHPKAVEPYRKAVPLSGNVTSVVITIDWQDTSVLLGADMECTADHRSGWGAAISQAALLGRTTKSEVVKIPHHGSENAHDDRMWQELLKLNPTGVIAPFGRGSVDGRPPKSNDIRRIRGLCGSLFVTARHRIPQKPAIDATVKRSLRDGGIKMTNHKTPVGIVRLRRKPGQDWNPQLLGPTAYRVT